MMAGGAELDQLTHELRQDPESARSPARSDDGTGHVSLLRGRTARAAAHRRGPDRLRLARSGPQPLHAADQDAVRRARVRPRARDLQRHRPRARGGGDRVVRLPARVRGLAPGCGRPGGGRGVHRRAQRHARGADRGGRAGRQGRVLREAGGRDPGRDRPRRARRAARGRDQRRGLQLPLGAARALRGPARGGRARGHRPALPRALLLDVRERPARPALLALPRGRGRARSDHRPDEPLGRPGPHARRADRARGGHHRDLHPRAAAAGSGRRHALRPRAAGRPGRRGHERGLRRHALRVRERRARELRGRPDADRAREPDGLRPARERGGDRLEPGADERAPALSRDRRARTPATPRSTAGSASPTTATSCREARTGSASRTSW